MGYGLSEIWTQSLAQRQHSGEVSYHNCVVPFLGSSPKAYILLGLFFTTVQLRLYLAAPGC